VLIEHNLDVIKLADWIVDLGPEGGDAGGEVVAMGRPEDVAKLEDSHTGRWLAPLLAPRKNPSISPRVEFDRSTNDSGARQLAL
jgi:excinuclease ABC subunit A